MTADEPRRSRHRQHPSTPPVSPAPKTAADAVDAADATGEARDDEQVAARAREALRKLSGPHPTQPAQPVTDPHARRFRLALYLGGILAVVVVLGGGAIGLYTLSIGQDVADLAATGEVAANRERAAAELLGYPGADCSPTRPTSVTFECLNRDRATLGLAPVVPIDGLAPSQLGALLGEARSDLNRIRQQREGAPRSGVSSPPTTGRFPR